MLVDTSIWVKHLRHGQLGLVSLLHRAEVQILDHTGLVLFFTHALRRSWTLLLVRLQHFDNRPHVEGFKLNFSWQGTLYFFSPPLLISFACFSRVSSVRGGSPAFSIDLNTA